jgi:hypothetical protein
MKILLFSLVCVFINSSVLANEWLTAGGQDGDLYKVSTQVTRQGSLRIVTYMRNFDLDGQKMSQKIVDSMDCAKKTKTLTSLVTYKGYNFSGPVFPYKSPSIGKVEKIDMNAVTGYAYELFCPSDKPVEMVWRISNPSEPNFRTDFIDATSCREFASTLNYSKPGYRCSYVPR